MQYKANMMLLAAAEAAKTTTNYGKNIADWGLDQIFWLILLIGIAVIAGSFIKKNWVGAGITLVAVAIVCYFIKNPTKLSDLGTTISKIIGL